MGEAGILKNGNSVCSETQWQANHFGQKVGQSIGDYKNAQTDGQCMSLMKKNWISIFENLFFPKCQFVRPDHSQMGIKGAWSPNNSNWLVSTQPPIQIKIRKSFCLYAQSCMAWKIAVEKMSSFKQIRIKLAPLCFSGGSRFFWNWFVQYLALSVIFSKSDFNLSSF